MIDRYYVIKQLDTSKENKFKKQYFIYSAANVNNGSEVKEPHVLLVRGLLHRDGGDRDDDVPRAPVWWHPTEGGSSTAVAIPRQLRFFCYYVLVRYIYILKCNILKI